MWFGRYARSAAEVVEKLLATAKVRIDFAEKLHMIFF